MITTARNRFVLLAYRLGFGWLVGRRYAIISTQPSGVDQPLASVEPFVWQDNLIVVAVPDAGATWVDHVSKKPVAMIQAAPGPLSAAADRNADQVRFRPTGQPAPYPVDADLLWVTPVVVVLAIVLRARR